MIKRVPIFLVVALVLILSLSFVLLPTHLRAEVEPGVVSSQLDTVKVVGSAEIRVTPDKCSIDVGVSLLESTAERANQELGARSDAIIAALKAQGVKDEDIQTDYYRVNTEYKWVDNERKVTGYRGSCDIEVSGIDIDKITTVIDTAVHAGADSIGYIRYYSSTYDQCYNDALAKAIQVARAKADKMGETAGFHVVRVHTMQEGYQDSSTRYVSNSVDFAEDAAVAGVSSNKGSSISVGDLSIEAYVVVEYVIG